VSHKKNSIKEQKVSNLQMFLIFSFVYLCIDQRESCHIGIELINIIFLLFICKKKTLYHSPRFLTLVWSKANSSSNNPCDQWMIFFIVNWIENGIWGWFLSILMSLIIGSIGVQPTWIYIVCIKVNRLFFSYHFIFEFGKDIQIMVYYDMMLMFWIYH